LGIEHIRDVAMGPPQRHQRLGAAKRCKRFLRRPDVRRFGENIQ